MKTLKYTRMTLVIIFLAQLAFQLESCQKSVSFPEQPGDSEFATQSNNSNSKALPHTKQYPAEVATAWFTLIANLSKTTPYNNPITVRLMAYAGMTLYESVVPGMPSYQSMYKYLTGNNISFDNKKDYYWPASANAALARITAKLLQNYPASPNLAAIQALEISLNNSYQPFVTPEQLQLSNEFGRSVADIIYEWSKTDGTLNSNGTLAPCPPYIPLGVPGTWVPTPPVFAAANGGCQGALRTFVPGITTTTLPSAPPVYSTNPNSDFYKMAQEIQQISLTTTPADINIVQAWRDLLGTNYNGPAHMIKLSSEIIDKENMNLEEASVTYAKQGIALFDAVVSAFHAKFYYALLRPVTYIRSVMGFSTWNSVYTTPQHPSYSDEAVGTQAASVYLLEQTFGANYSFVDSTQKSLYGSFSYSSFDDLLLDVGKSRTHSGINFKRSVSEGANQGRKIGQLVNQLPFKKL